MIKYILKRLILGILSACIVTVIVMVLIYSCMDRSLVFANDQAYSRKYNNDKVVYRYEKYQEYGYIDYLSYSDYVGILVKGNQITKQEGQEALVFGVEKADKTTFIAPDDPDITKQCITKFVASAEAGKYTCERLDLVQERAGQTAQGGNVKFYSYRERPLIYRVGSFFANLFHLDNIHYAESVTGNRGISFTWNDPAYGGNTFSPAIMGNGTQYKYLLYFDGKFPFVHSNLLTIRLGTSVSINQGVDVWDTMTKDQDPVYKTIVYFPSGVAEESSSNLHTLEYVNGSYSDLDPTIYRRFVDDYTYTIDLKSGSSKMGYSFLIGILAVLFSYIIGLPIGILMAKHKGKIADILGTVYIVFIIAVPSLAYILMFQVFGNQVLKLPATFYTDSINAAKYGALVYILPIISLMLPSIAGLMQWTRRYMIDQTNSDYVKFARAGGLSEGEIFTKHIFKNAAIPIVHGIPSSIIGALTGAIMTERIYTVPGVGNVLTNAINKYDNAVIVGITFFYAILSVISILLGDILMTIMDPRINISGKGR